MIDSKPWANRAHPGRPTVPLELSAKDRRAAVTAMRPGKAQKRIVLRAQALVLMADRVADTDIAKLLGVHLRTVQKWRVRFKVPHPATKLADAPRSGRPPSLSAKRPARKS